MSGFRIVFDDGTFYQPTHEKSPRTYTSREDAEGEIRLMRWSGIPWVRGMFARARVVALSDDMISDGS